MDSPALSAEVGNPVTHALWGDRPFGFGKVFAAHRECEEPRCLSTIYIPVGSAKSLLRTASAKNLGVYQLYIFRWVGYAQ